MSGLLLVGLVLGAAGYYALRDEVAARKRRRDRQKLDLLGARLRVPAYQRKRTLPPRY